MSKPTSDSSRHLFLSRVTRPGGGINEWLLWLPISIHKKVYYIIKQLFLYSRLISRHGGDKLFPFHTEIGSSAGLSYVLDADVKILLGTFRYAGTVISTMEIGISLLVEQLQRGMGAGEECKFKGD
ncbi:mitochondrial fission protein ELM1-like isoform X1 [Apium graveolens]|uniref:mitochondrial fission protein ELM1-like isoform X1 n=1 Tax=Apium graveolens TaxID=4045 RepID=UPI003D7A3B9C